MRLGVTKDKVEGIVVFRKSFTSGNILNNFCNCRLSSDLGVRKALFKPSVIYHLTQWKATRNEVHNDIIAKLVVSHITKLGAWNYT